MNYRGLEILEDAIRLTFRDNKYNDREYVVRYDNHRRKRRKLLCSSMFKVQEVGRKLENYIIKLIFKFHILPGLGHECIVVDYKKLLKFIFKICKLGILANKVKGIEIALTLDRAKLINNLSHVTCSSKIIDVQVRYPCTNKLVFNFQSWDYSFIFESHVIKDSIEAYKYLKGF